MIPDTNRHIRRRRGGPTEQSVTLLRAILLTLNQSVIPGVTPVPPPAQKDPSEIVTVTGLMYASLLISLLAAFVAVLRKARR